MKLVELVGIHVEARSGAPVLLLREHDEPHRVVPIFVGPNEAAAIAMALTGALPPRPLTHDLLASLVETLDGHVDAVEVTEVRDGAFIADLSVSGPHGRRHVDARPSDGIALALRVGAPVYVSEDVLDEAGAEITAEGADEDAVSVDEEVEEFRQFLDDLDPSDFEP